MAFGHEELDVYRLSLEYVAQVFRLAPIVVPLYPPAEALGRPFAFYEIQRIIAISQSLRILVAVPVVEQRSWAFTPLLPDEVYVCSGHKAKTPHLLLLPATTGHRCHQCAERSSKGGGVIVLRPLLSV